MFVLFHDGSSDLRWSKTEKSVVASYIPEHW